jgi:hypothetical protein
MSRDNALIKLFVTRPAVDGFGRFVTRVRFDPSTRLLAPSLAPTVRPDPTYRFGTSAEEARRKAIGAALEDLGRRIRAWEVDPTSMILVVLDPDLSFEVP